MCQQKPIVLLSSAQHVQTHPSLALPVRQSPVPDNLMSLNTEENKDIKMEGGGMLPPTPIIQTSLLQQNSSLPQHPAEGKDNEVYAPLEWETKYDHSNNGSQTAFGKQGNSHFQCGSSNKKRPVSDIGAELQNRWKHKKEPGKGALANRSLSERNSNLSFQVFCRIFQRNIFLFNAVVENA